MSSTFDSNNYKELFTLAEEIKSQDPWSFLDDSTFCFVILPNRQERAMIYCLNGGKEGCCVNFHVGEESIYKHFELIQNPGYNEIQTRRFKDYCSLMFTDKQYVDKKGMEIINELSLDFGDKAEWVHFTRNHPSYIPYTIDENDIDLFKYLMQQFLEIIKDLKEGKVKVDFNKEEVPFRTFVDDNLVTTVTTIAVPVLTMLDLKASNPELIQKLIEAPQVASELEMDISYIPTTIEDPQLKGIMVPKIVYVIDAEEDELILKDKNTLDISDVDVMLNVLTNYILNFGRPKSVTVRDNIIFEAVRQLCELTSIELKVSPTLPYIDSEIKDFVNKYLK